MPESKFFKQQESNNLRVRKIKEVTIIGSVINILLSGLKFAAGIVGHSNALIADGVHSLSDLSTDIVVIFGVSLANRPKDKTHDYGHGKFETIASLLIGLALLAVGIGILKEGIGEIIYLLKGGKVKRIEDITLVIALTSILAKELLYRYSYLWSKKLESGALKANALHHRSDALSSVGVAIGLAGAIFLGKKWQILDPIAATIVGIFVIKSGVFIVKENIEELTEGSLDEETEREILSIIREIDGVYEPHNLKTRRIGKNIAIDVHIRVNKNLNIDEGHRIATEVENKLRTHYGNETLISVHIEPY